MNIPNYCNYFFSNKNITNGTKNVVDISIFNEASLYFGLGVNIEARLFFRPAQVNGTNCTCVDMHDLVHPEITMITVLLLLK